MTSTTFQQANITIGPPLDLADGTVNPVLAHVRKSLVPALDGITLVVVAWKPDQSELKRLCDGGLIYLTCLGSIPPHFISTTFEEAVQEK